MIAKSFFRRLSKIPILIILVFGLLLPPLIAGAGFWSDDPEEIKLFDEEGYLFNAPLSDEKAWVFTR